MRFFIALFLMSAFCFNPAYARFDAPSYSEWIGMMLARLPFRNGVLTRDQYAEASRNYLSGLIEFYRTVDERKIDFARRHGRPAFASQIQMRTEIEIDRARRYVADAQVGLFTSLDPKGNGSVTLEQAQQSLQRIARFADFNRNGVLEPMEADIAEAALVRGADLSDPVASDAFLRELDRGFHPLDGE
jgi:hypothetical protein